MNAATSFDELYRKHAAAVYRVCVRKVARREVAEEITSEVFLTLHQSWQKLTEEQMPAWLFTVANRRCADYWRRHFVEDNWASIQTESTRWTEPEHPLADLLERCTSLKPVHRVCLTLRFAQGMSRKEISEYTSLSELQVKGHLQYALQLLRYYIHPEAANNTGKGGETHAEADATIRS